MSTFQKFIFHGPVTINGQFNGGNGLNSGKRKYKKKQVASSNTNYKRINPGSKVTKTEGESQATKGTEGESKLPKTTEVGSQATKGTEGGNKVTKITEGGNKVTKTTEGGSKLPKTAEGESKAMKATEGGSKQTKTAEKKKNYRSGNRRCFKCSTSHKDGTPCAPVLGLPMDIDIGMK